MSEETKAFIQSLKDYNKETLCRSIFIPSLGEDITFYPMTTKHQKAIIESSLDNPIYNAIFQQKAYEIVKELCTRPEIVDNFTTFDKDAVLIQMRYAFIDTKYDDKEFENVINKIKTFEESLTPEEKTVNGFKVVFKIPTFKDEYKLYKEFQKLDSYVISPSDDDDIRKMLANLYVLELSKYVSSITIIDRDLTMNFSNHGVDECMEIIDNIDKSVTKCIQDYINDQRTKHKDFYTIDEDTEIAINSELFS